MSVPTRLCPYCHAGTAADQSRCWLCESALPPFAQRLDASDAGPALLPAGVSAHGAPELPRRAETDVGLWAATSLVAIAVMILIVVELASLDRTFALLAATACVPAVGTLGAMLWARRPRSDRARVQVGSTALPRGWVLAVVGLVTLSIAAIGVALAMVGASALQG